MNRNAILKSLATVALALGTLAAATSAQAGNDVQFSVTLGTPGIHVQSAPHYAYPRHQIARPAPIYLQPRPVYVQPAPVYVRPHPVYAQPAPIYYRGHQRHHHYGNQVNARGPRGDRDRDGVPNRYDRFPRDSNWR